MPRSLGATVPVEGSVMMFAMVADQADWPRSAALRMPAAGVHPTQHHGQF